MAASSPALGNNSIGAPPKTLRGLNKPKCSQCGNVARSRCPFHCCKSCCSKLENPCPIHVLKANATFTDKTPTSSSPLFEQPSTEASSAGNALRVASLRQLSSNFAQFNNLQVPLRSRKPLTKKDAAAINEWRFAKIKEYKDRNIEIENEAFDRYMQNISMLEEVFSVEPMLEGSPEDGSPLLDTSATEHEVEKKYLGQKSELRSSTMRSDKLRRRIQQIVNQGLRKLQECEMNEEVDDTNNKNEHDRKPKKMKSWRAERFTALSELLDKLDKARSNEDLKACLEMKSQLPDLLAKSMETETKEDAEVPKNDSGKTGWSPRIEGKLFRAIEIDQETLNSVNRHFSSLEEIEDL
ncbi:hypothetical protein HS088_TW15G00601 [Tripterygium wilfordii]|uniref:Electron carrier/iron ion-binding protein n=1 Tax=Tripterygium wilfordii TaxID=458696 RepID=A0A7J7CM60_TRIWF|nr:uncharacterized protein LOC120015937 [Tripterygium wilfordii]XP_038724379.1 uncharacterized protein LOC120015937 [Tripterygium wilfordii]XP_038724380.1 uncharacterized protein LOC120015937 [Tripterygium wilfordii]KAF5735101.1 hypothetical protein HS088_TW15G00601 [Tripterygium wilfordii]